MSSWWVTTPTTRGISWASGTRATFPRSTGGTECSGRVPSETRYADVDWDGRPDVAIGRLPAQDPADADLLVEKIARWRESGPRKGHLIAVDESQGGRHLLPGEGESLMSRLPVGSVNFVDVGAQGVAAAHTALIEGLKQGAQTTSYFGTRRRRTSGRTRDCSRIRTGRARRERAARPSSSAGPARRSGTSPESAPSRGAAPRAQRGEPWRAWAGRDLRPDAAGEPLATGLHLLPRGKDPGEAVRLAKSDALAEDPGLAPVVQGFSLLGDPSIKLRGPSLALTASPHRG
jgi:hypothetical protein